MGKFSSSGTLKAHHASASKVGPHNAFSSSNSTPKLKKGTFTGSGSDSSSSDSDSDSEVDTKKESAADFAKKVSGSSSKAKDALKASKPATPARSQTVNGLGASASTKKKELSASVIKKEDTSSDSDSESSSDQKTKAKSATTSSSSESSSDSKSESDKAIRSKSKSPVKSSSKAKATEKKESKKHTPKAKSPVKKEMSSDSSSSSAESESESESEEGEKSEDPSQQIEEQLRNDLLSVKSQSSKSKTTSEKPSTKKKVKVVEVAAQDEDSDIEMMDQSMALTNGGVPTKVGDVPEFVAPDFHLRKLEKQSNAADVANIFSKAQLEGKQVWYITAPESLPVTVVQDLSIPMDKAQQGLSVLSHNGDDYRLAFENPTASSSFRLLIPSKKGDEYSPLGRAVDQTMHFTRSETFPPEGPSSVVTTQTISTSKPARPQPPGLRARYTPLGVPTPKPILAPVQKALTSISAANVASTPTKGSSKKKRKHAHDGEDGSVATPVIPVSATTKASYSNKKTPKAEKSAKKQKTSRDNTPRKETPVPLPQLGSRSNSMNSLYSASQPLPRPRQSASPGAMLPATQVPIPAKYTPIPFPTFPMPSSSAMSGPSFSSPSMTRDAEKQVKKAEKERKKAEKQADKQAKEAEKQRKRTEKDAARAGQSPPKQTQILPPRFDSRGVPIY